MVQIHVALFTKLSIYTYMYIHIDSIPYRYHTCAHVCICVCIVIGIIIFIIIIDTSILNGTLYIILRGGILFGCLISILVRLYTYISIHTYIFIHTYVKFFILLYCYIFNQVYQYISFYYIYSLLHLKCTDFSFIN